MKVDLDPSSGNESFTVNVSNLVVRSFVVPNDTEMTRGSIVGFAAGVEPTDITAVRRDDHVTALKDETSVSITLSESLILALYNLSGASFGPPIMNLKDPVTITALVDHYDPRNNYSCVFWNTTAANGRGTWQEEGCALTNRSNKHFTCHCNHLTSFAILVDFTTKLVTGEPPPFLPAFLDTLTIAALSVSIVGAALTIGLMFLSRHLAKTTDGKKLTKRAFVIISMCAGLLLTYVTFLAGVDKVVPRAGCIAAGCLIHYFFLVTFTWQGVEGFLLYRVFAAGAGAATNGIRFFRLKSSVISWGIPLVIIAIVLIISPEYYVGNNRLTSRRQSSRCWLRNPASFYSAFIAPICLVLLANSIVFVLLIRELSCAKKENIRSTKEKEQLATKLRRAIFLFFSAGTSVAVPHA
ncbi:putative Adhesion G-protein coupled receptor G2 [Hypsibius exemplaris]|uniref:Adhesion G-protein coupled receptor G2 n=1 Tax=Hypsibius exemplaris TaxID=2072580 RepID=A0A1W0WCI5_HYPEX|nr:putative Adhesion G-protein coupled receptor G2 [Hypsibius exemplaris]